MLEQLKFYIMLIKSCDELSNKELEDLLYEFESNLQHLKNSLNTKREYLDNLKVQKKKNSDFLFSPYIDNKLYIYQRAIDNIHETKVSISADRVAIKNNKMAKNMITMILRKRK